MIPMMMAAIGIFASIVGTFFVRTGEKVEQKALLGALRRGVYISSGIIMIVSYILVTSIFGMERIGLYFAIISGLLAGVLIGFFTEYYTSDTYKPTRKVAESGLTGPATVIISGMSLGFLSHTHSRSHRRGIGTGLVLPCRRRGQLQPGPVRRRPLGGGHAVYAGHHTGHRRVWPRGG